MSCKTEIIGRDLEKISSNFYKCQVSSILDMF